MFHRIETEQGSSVVWTQGDPDRTGVAFRYIAEAYPEEPLFCIRGRDMLAIPAASAYLGLLAAHTFYRVENAIMEDVAVMRKWQMANRDLLKYPDR